MLAHLRGEGTVDGIDLIADEGIKHIKNGETITLTSNQTLLSVKKWNADWTALSEETESWNKKGAIPVMPAKSGIEGTFTLSGDTVAKLVNGVLVPQTAINGDFSTLNVAYTENGIEKTMSFRVETPFKDSSISMEIAPVYDNKSAIYNLTTDDGNAQTTAWLDTELKSRNLKATMGLVINHMGGENRLTWEQAEAYVNAPDSVWGVANHTKSHHQGAEGDRFYEHYTDAELDKQINGARATLRSHFPNEKIVGMYAPGGQFNEKSQAVAEKEHFSHRMAGGNTYNALPISENDMYYLKCWNVSSNTLDFEKLKGGLDKAIENGGWHIEMLHGVTVNSVADGWEPVPDTAMSDYLDYVKEKMDSNQLWVTTLDEASVYAKQRLKTLRKLLLFIAGAFLRYYLFDKQNEFGNKFYLDTYAAKWLIFSKFLSINIIALNLLYKTNAKKTILGVDYFRYMMYNMLN